MNDLEEALRSELRDRADAADREVSLLEPVASRVRRARCRCTLATFALTAIVGVGLMLTVPASTTVRPAMSGISSPGAAVRSLHGPVHRPAAGYRSVTADTMAAGGVVIPPGWAPVAFLGAQISVPSGWLVERGGGSACGGSGMVFLARAPRPRVFKALGCRLAANVVTLVDVGQSYGGLGSSSHAARDALFSARYDLDYVLAQAAPHLGVKVTARGPLAGRVLATLTRSLRSAVLARGPRTPVPAGWRWHDFGGIRFAAPASWAVERDAWWGGCTHGIASRTVRLSAAAAPSAPGCGGLPLDTAGLKAATPGVVIGAGRYAAAEIPTEVTATPCLRLGGMRACVLQPDSDNDVLLKVAVFPPGEARPTLVEIGLAGSGATARAILDSIRPRDSGGLDAKRRGRRQ